jgi:hypothetical protein
MQEPVTSPDERIAEVDRLVALRTVLDDYGEIQNRAWQRLHNAIEAVRSSAWLETFSLLQPDVAKRLREASEREDLRETSPSRSERDDVAEVIERYATKRDRSGRSRDDDEELER